MSINDHGLQFLQEPDVVALIEACGAELGDGYAKALEAWAVCFHACDMMQVIAEGPVRAVNPHLAEVVSDSIAASRVSLSSLCIDIERRLGLNDQDLDDIFNRKYLTRVTEMLGDFMVAKLKQAVETRGEGEGNGNQN